MFCTDDTIVAIATPPGRAGLGVIRVSGPDAEAVASRLLTRRDPLLARQATLSHVRDLTIRGELSHGEVGDRTAERTDSQDDRRTIGSGNERSEHAQSSRLGGA